MIAASQDYQAFVLKYHTEFFRRHKFAPCNGALFFQFRDCWPAVTASVVDYYGKRKKGYFALQQAFNPIHVMMDWPDLAGEPAGSTFRRAIYVVNDYAAAHPSLTVMWQVLGAGTPCSPTEPSPAQRPPTTCNRSPKSHGPSPPPAAATA